MAKNNMLLGYARGKVGDLVFQRRKGEQIVKARNRNPNNPRTWAQQMQRVRMYAPVAFYKVAVDNFFRFAFEKKKPNETDYNAFIRENLNAFQGPYFTRSQVQQKYPTLAPYIVSAGSLGNIKPSFITGSNKNTFSIDLEVNGETAPENTVGSVSQRLIDLYNLQQGDMLTFLSETVIGVTIDSDGTVTYAGETVFSFANFTIDTLSTTPVNQAYGGVFMLETGADIIDSLSYVESVPDGTNKAVVYAVITTRRTNGKILSSTTSLQMNPLAKQYFEAMSTTQQLIIAAQSYDATSSALDPNSAKVMNEASSQTNSVNGRSTKQTAMNCIPTTGSKSTDGIQPYTLNNVCQTCSCEEGKTEPEPCQYEQGTSSTRRSSRKTSNSNASE